MGKDLVLDELKPVFLTGPPRSGTTLLQLLLSSHSKFSSAPETHFFSYVLQPIEDWPTKKLSAERLDSIFERLAGKPMIDVSREFREVIRQKASSDGISAGSLLNELMVYLSGASEKTQIRWIEKTPRHALYVGQILRIYPKAKIITIIRDPRDVVSSQSPFGNFRSKVQLRRYRLSRAERWNVIVESVMRLVPNENIFLIRYEDMVQRPETSLKEIMEFLEEEYEPKMLSVFSANYEKVVRPGEARHKNLCSIGEIVDRRNMWKMRMGKFEALLVEAICEPLMVHYGYLPHRVRGMSRVCRANMLRYEKKRLELISSLRKKLGSSNRVLRFGSLK
jgi:hypothetical protein